MGGETSGCNVHKWISKAKRTNNAHFMWISTAHIIALCRVCFFSYALLYKTKENGSKRCKMRFAHIAYNAIITRNAAESIGAQNIRAHLSLPHGMA
jgi:hypothetical protein